MTLTTPQAQSIYDAVKSLEMITCRPQINIKFNMYIHGVDKHIKVYQDIDYRLWIDSGYVQEQYFVNIEEFATKYKLKV